MFLKGLYFEDSLYPKLSTNGKQEVSVDKSRLIVSSGLINACYSNSIGTSLRFFGSIRNIKKYVLTEAEHRTFNGSREIIYVDAPADNANVLLDYLSILEVICEFKLFNIIILPIPCMEYYVLKSFGNVSGSDKQVLECRGLYKETVTYRQNMNSKWSTFERYCKALVSVAVPQQYRGSLPLDKFGMLVDSGDNWLLLHNLPLFVVSDKDPLPMREVYAQDVEQYLFDNLQEQVELYIQNGYIKRHDFLQQLCVVHSRYQEGLHCNTMN